MKQCDYCGTKWPGSLSKCPRCDSVLDKKPDNVVSIDEAKPHFSILAMCLPCSYRWIGLIVSDVNPLTLECPSCHACESFVSFIPADYLQASAPKGGA